MIPITLYRTAFKNRDEFEYFLKELGHSQQEIDSADEVDIEVENSAVLPGPYDD